jgi:hypothetical protein
MTADMVSIYGEELLATLLNHRLEDHTLPTGRYCLFNVLAVTVHIKILQFRYLILIPVAHFDKRNSVFFPWSFQREYVPLLNCFFLQHGNIYNAPQQTETLHFQTEIKK